MKQLDDFCNAMKHYYSLPVKDRIPYWMTARPLRFLVSDHPHIASDDDFLMVAAMEELTLVSEKENTCGVSFTYTFKEMTMFLSLIDQVRLAHLLSDSEIAQYIDTTVIDGVMNYRIKKEPAVREAALEYIGVVMLDDDDANETLDANFANELERVAGIIASEIATCIINVDRVDNTPANTTFVQGPNTLQ